MGVAVLGKVPPAGIGGALAASFTIVSLYATLVFAVGKFVRASVKNMKFNIPFQQLPDPSRLAALVRDIYIARAEGDLELEEELFYTLITVFRTPAILLELTRKNLRDK